MPDPLPPGSPYVLRGDTLRARADAAAIREAALADADAVRARAEAEARARAESLLGEARARAMSESAALLARAAGDADALLRAREEELTALAFALAHRLVNDLPRDTRTLRLVWTALAEHRDVSRLVLRAPPATAASLRAGLCGGDGDARGRACPVEVVDDATLGADECVLVHPKGRTALGPLQQFRALMDGLVPGGIA
jgi:flagellar biosynthesis/type III secretory pathway protein FliH